LNCIYTVHAKYVLQTGYRTGRIYLSNHNDAVTDPSGQVDISKFDIN